MNKETIFAGLVGLFVGGGVAGFATYSIMKRKYTSILKETVDSYEKELAEANAFLDDDIPDEFRRYIPESDEDEDEDKPKLSSEEKNTIKEKLKYNNNRTTEYAKMYNTSRMSAGDVIDAMADDGAPDPQELAEAENEDKDEKEVSDSVRIFDAINKTKDRKPVIISAENYINFCENSSAWDTSELFLYSNGVVTTEDDKVIDEEELVIMLGDCLDKYGFRESEEKTIYVQCYKLSTVYEITKFDKPFVQ